MQQPKSRKRKTLDLEIFFIIIGAVVSLPVLSLLYKLYRAEETLIPISSIIIVAGISSEYRRYFSWKKLVLILLGAFIVSFFFLIPLLYKGVIEMEGMQVWAIYFVCILIFGIVIIHRKDFMPRINEGIVLLQTVAIIYWAAANDNSFEYNWFIDIFFVAGIFLALYTLLQIFTYSPHSRTGKLLLSTWSCIIVFIIGIDNTYKVISGIKIEDAACITQIIFLTLQYFLLGVSVLYIINAVIVVLSLFAGKGNLNEADYREEKRALIDIHVSRVGSRQLKKIHGLAIIAVTTVVFGANYFFRVLPANFVIWCTLVLLPTVMHYYDSHFFLPKISNESDAKYSFKRSYKRYL